ncbi:unnamed protein product [Caenorhabditis nigoni]
MKLHRMPILIKRMIIEELGFDERLFMSFTSKRTCSFLGLFRTDFKPIFIAIHIYDWQAFIFVRQASYRLSYEMFGFNVSPMLMNNDWTFTMEFIQRHVKDSSDWTIDGTTVQVKKGHSSTMECSLNEDRDGFGTTISGVTLFGKILRHLNSFYNIQECIQCVFDMHIPNGLIPELDCNYSYGLIDMPTSFISNVTPENLSYLLENIKITRLCLNVNVPSVPGYKYQSNPEKKSSIDVLKVIHYSWVDVSDLPAARVISFLEFQPCEMNAVLRYWVAGRNRNFDIGDFEIYRLTGLNREAIFNGITRHETQLTGAEIRSFVEYMDDLHNTRLLRYSRNRFIVTVDIVRESDGMRATVIEGNSINEDFRNMCVMVWSESNLRTIGRATD